MTSPDLTVVIPTHDRPAGLAETLAALRAVEIPPGIEVELLVIDNAPTTEDTRELVLAWKHSPFEVRYLREPRAGVARARNAAVRAARGRVTLWTDDDVRPPPHWVAGLALPVLAGKAAVLQGGIELAPHLLRPWMDVDQRGLFASTEVFDLPRFQGVVPAGRTLLHLFTSNMAVAREVFARVPAFDENLGAGALGYSEDQLMAHHLFRAGVAIGDGRHVVSQHHFDPDRLTHRSCASMWERLGRSQAYVDYHWQHRTPPWARLGAGHLARALLSARRALLPPPAPEGIRPREAELRYVAGYCRQLADERRRPARLYEKHGLPRAVPA